MAKRRRRHSGSAPIDGSGGPPPIIPPVIFTGGVFDPRFFWRPVTGSHVPGGTPSRIAMVFIYGVIVGVIALCALGVILNALHN